MGRGVWDICHRNPRHGGRILEQHAVQSSGLEGTVAGMARKTWKILGVLRQSIEGPTLSSPVFGHSSAYVAFASEFHAGFSSYCGRHVPFSIGSHRVQPKLASCKLYSAACVAAIQYA